jgi:hypothetical protein
MNKGILGRVPLFFFLLHYFLIHALAVLAAAVRGLPVGWLCSDLFLNNSPKEWPLSLPGIYAVWVALLILVYIPCRWFAGVKERHRGGWLS